MRYDKLSVQSMDFAVSKICLMKKYEHLFSNRIVKKRTKPVIGWSSKLHNKKSI